MSVACCLPTEPDPGPWPRTGPIPQPMNFLALFLLPGVLAATGSQDSYGSMAVLLPTLCPPPPPNPPPSSRGLLINRSPHSFFFALSMQLVGSHSLASKAACYRAPGVELIGVLLVQVATLVTAGCNTGDCRLAGPADRCGYSVHPLGLLQVSPSSR